MMKDVITVNPRIGVKNFEDEKKCCECCQRCDLLPFKNYEDEGIPGRQERKKSWITIDKEFVVRDQSLKRFRRVIKMLIVIVLVFAICWTPHLTFLLLQGFGVIPVQLDGPLKFAKTAFILMAYMNSALNPVIYGFMSKSFRTSFRKTVCNCQLYAKNEEPMATQWEHEGKGEEVEIQPQICCNHRNTAVLTNNHGLRINHSRGALNRYVNKSPTQ